MLIEGAMAQKKPLVSVVVAIYNQGQLISDAVASVLRQTFTDWELVICDDGSTDNTYAILSKYKELYPDRITLLRNDKNEGVSRARNRAIKKSSGEYIAFLDSDDWWDEKKLEKQVRLFKESLNVGLVFTKASVIGDGNFSKSEILAEESYFKKLCGVDKISKKKLMKENNICFSSIMVLRKAIEMAGYFDEKLLYQVEDWILSLKIIYLFDLSCVSERLTNYRLHKDSYSARFFLKEKMAKESFIQIRCVVFRFMLKNLFIKKASTGILERVLLIASFCASVLEDEIMLFVRKNHRIIKTVRFLKQIAYHLLGFINRIKFSEVPNLLILFVTAKCNSKCKTCFYWKDVNNTKKELELKNIKTIFDTMPKTACVLITGGEPFLRSDIADVLILTANNENILSVSINTNGTMPDKIDYVMRNVLRQRKNPKNYFINISLDGFRPTHNKIRGINCYDQAIETINMISELKRDFDNLYVSAITVISNDNMIEIRDFAKFVFAEVNLDFHYFEIIRGAPRAMEMLKLNKEIVKDLYFNILSIQEMYFKKQGMSNIKTEMAKLYHAQRLQFENFFEGKNWDIQCLAGEKVFVIYENGKFSVCEQRNPIIDIKDFGYDLRKVLKSNIVKGELEKISEEKCFCTHGCFISGSMFPRPRRVKSFARKE